MKCKARLEASVNANTKQYDWYVDTDHPEAARMGNGVCGYFPDSLGEASLKACETWLANRGFTPDGDMPPQCFEYTCELCEIRSDR